VKFTRTTSGSASRGRGAAGSATVASGGGGTTRGGSEKERADTGRLAVTIGLCVSRGSTALVARHSAFGGCVYIGCVRAGNANTGSLAAEIGAACRLISIQS
jgi:hypothetical protein